jgi:hypothetical protein
MNLRGETSLDWADGTYSFRLSLAGAIELEDKCDAPIAVIHARLIGGAYKVSDVRETIRIGLIGGGLDPAKALNLVRTYVDERPLSESWVIARLVMGGLLYGFEAHPINPPGPAAKAENRNASTPPASTKISPFSGLEDLLETYPSGNMPLS